MSSTETFETEDFDSAVLAPYELESAYRVWMEARPKGRLFPSRSDLDILLLKALLSRLTLYDVVDGGGDFRYRVHATESAVFLGEERTGMLRSEIAQPPEKAARMNALLRRVVASRRPLLSRLRSQSRQPPPLLSRLFLPLGHDDHAVDMILVVREPASAGLAGPYL